MDARRFELCACVGTLVLVVGLSACAAAQSPWVDERVAGPMVFRSEFSLDNCGSLLSDLAQLQRDLVGLLALPAAAEPIEVYLFAGKQSYDQYLVSHLPHLTYRRALYVKSGGLGRVYAYRSSEFETDVRHECTHGLLHASLPTVPLWLDEGLAEYFEVPPEGRAQGGGYAASMRRALRWGKVPSLEALEKKQKLEEAGGDDYRNAWAWIHFLLYDSPEGYEELVGYVADLRAGLPAERLQMRLRRRLPGLESRFSTHFRNWSPARAASVRLGSTVALPSGQDAVGR